MVLREPSAAVPGTISMHYSKTQFGGLIFLLLSIAYGYSATSIALFPGDEAEPVSARTLPYFLAGLGCALSLYLLLFGRDGDSVDEVAITDLDWKLAAGLLLLMIAYGLALEWLGFLVATTLFLIIGFRLLGEHRPKVLLAVSVPFTLGFWLLLTKALDIYLAPGQMLTFFGG
jgi:putative tricarboxylic transport membrane protein